MSTNNALSFLYRGCPRCHKSVVLKNPDATITCLDCGITWINTSDYDMECERKTDKLKEQIHKDFKEDIQKLILQVRYESFCEVIDEINSLDFLCSDGFINHLHKKITVSYDELLRKKN